MHTVLTNESFLEVAIESRPEWDLNAIIYIYYIYIYIYYRYIYIYIDIYICELVNLTRNKIKWITKKFIHPYYSLNSDSELAHWK